MSKQLRTSIVRIYGRYGRIVGMGFLVIDREILTCAHVIAQALGIPEDMPEQPIEEIRLDFPLMTPKKILTARVVLWDPVATSWKTGQDIAVLKLEKDIPHNVQAISLIKSDELWGHTFRAFGFPAAYDDGVWTSGRLLERVSGGWVQIEDVKKTGFRVQPGFSGGPVWDEQLNGVVGITVAADMQTETKVAFIIPTQILIKRWPALAHRTIEADELSYLKEQLVAFETSQRNAANPRRYQSRINELQTQINNWEGRIEKQRKRIENGFTKQRQQIVEGNKQYHNQKHLSVIGHRPLGEINYFKDRQREQRTIGNLLAESTTRLVSIIGHGGMGKTALASKVLGDLERYRWPHTEDNIPLDGIVYLSTRTSGISLERLFLNCAKFLGEKMEKKLTAIWTNPKMTVDDKIFHLLDALKGGKYVILLDNLEDLLDNRGKLEDEDLQLFFNYSLTHYHGVKLLVTSRIAMAFKREITRFDRQINLLEGLPVEDGIALLKELDPNANYGLQDAPEEQLSKAVSMVHGVPRALEVIAGIMANDPFVSLDEVIDNFYEQEEVVQLLIEENYKRLDAKARKVIEALAVFKKPVPPLAVDYLLEPFSPGLDVPGIIRWLINTNIVNVDRATKTIVLHPIDLDYAYSQLSEDIVDGVVYTRRELERRAADYYAQLRTSPETWKTIDDLEPQLNEFEHLVRAEDYDRACQVLNIIDFEYLHLWGYSSKLIQLRNTLLDHIPNPTLRATNLGSLGIAYAVLGQHDQAAKFLEDALNTIPQTDELGKQSLWLAWMAWTHLLRGDIHHSIDLYNRAIDISRKIGDRKGEGNYIGNLGIAFQSLGMLEKSRELYEEALAIAREVNHRKREGIWLGHLGWISRLTGDFNKALEFLEKSLAIDREIGYRTGEIHRLNHLGETYLALGKVEKSLKIYKQALPVAHEIGGNRFDSYVYLGLGKTLLYTKELLEARCYCEKALSLNAPESDYQAALVLGLILLHQKESKSEEVFKDAIFRCQRILNKTEDFYEARYVLATALVGRAVCNPSWREENQREKLLAPALEQYNLALKTCAAFGILHEIMFYLKLIRKVGIDGLEPVFALIKSKCERVKLNEDSDSHDCW